MTTYVVISTTIKRQNQERPVNAFYLHFGCLSRKLNSVRRCDLRKRKLDIVYALDNTHPKEMAR